MKKYLIFSFILATMFFAAPAFVSADEVTIDQGRIIGIMDPVNPQDVATKNYVDNAVAMVPTPPAMLQTTGSSDTATMSQQAITQAVCTVDQKVLTFDMIYPVGAIFMSVNSVNPGMLFGGTWTQLENRVLLGAGSSYVAGATGGNATVTLVAANIPGHTHSFSATTNSTGAHTHGTSQTIDYTSNTSHTHNTRTNVLSEGVGTNRTGTYNNTYVSDSAGAHTHTVSGTTGTTGSGTAVNTMPPYLVVYMWKRIV